MLVLLLVVTSVLSYSIGQIAEPKCSQFDYEEKTLYKMVRLEFSVEQAVNEVKQVLSDMKDEVDKIKSERGKMKTEYERNKAEHNTAVNKLEAMKDNITGLAATPMIWFLAKDPVDSSPATDQVIVYGNVLHNVGNGYDASSGTFSAPVAGLYTFTMHACSHGKQTFYYSIIINGEPLVQGRDYNHDGYAPCTSATVYTGMATGDRASVSVTSGSSSNQIYSAKFYWNVFTGALIHK